MRAIASSVNGRLGNQLWQIAAGLSAALDNGAEFFINGRPGEWVYQPFFGRQMALADASGFHRPDFGPGFDYRGPIAMPPGDVRWRLEGYFLSHRYHSHNRAFIQNELRPSPAVEARVSGFLSQFGDRKLCSVHVRRDDFLGLPHFGFIGERYYERAIPMIGGDPLFLVFSDDMPWCRSFFKGPEFHFVEGNEDAVDNRIMSRCHAHVNSNSTFGWWAAYLDDRPGQEVVMPDYKSAYFREGAEGIKEFVLPGWRVVEGSRTV